MLKSPLSIGALIALILIIGPILFHVSGHTTVYSMYGAEERALQFIDENRPATDCFKMHSFIPTSPPLGMFQSGCIKKYAEISEDATVCESLLPSRSGMSCIGAAEESPETNCFLQRDGNLMCNLPGVGINQENYEIDQLDNCQLYEKYNNRDVIIWCAAERANEYGDLEGCLKIAQTDQERDLCHYKRASNLNDLRIDICENIIDKSKRLGCKATVRAWQKYPELKPQENWLNFL